MNIPAQITQLIEDGALFVINSSGGKDSQAMTALLAKIIPANQLIIAHAVLPEVEWEGVQTHIEATAQNIPVHYCQAEKTFFDMVEHRGMFPSSKYRQCTSDLKRNPLDKLIRHYMKANSFTKVVSCWGLRAQESPARSKKPVLKYDTTNSKAGREWYVWLPIHDMLLEEVWQTIKNAGQQPHYAYSLGMTRLSCCFCIMSSKHDLRIAAVHNPELFKRVLELELKHNHTMMLGAKQTPITLDKYIS